MFLNCVSSIISYLYITTHATPGHYNLGVNNTAEGGTIQRGVNGHLRERECVCRPAPPRDTVSLPGRADRQRLYLAGSYIYGSDTDPGQLHTVLLPHRGEYRMEDSTPGMSGVLTDLTED